MLFRHEMQWHKVYTRTDTRGDAILVGALVAQLWVRCHSPKKFIATAASAASVFLLWGLICLRPERPSLYMGVLTLIALAWGIIIIAILETDWWISPLLRFRPLRLLGRVSYGAYLWHLPIFVIVKREGAGLPAFVKVAIALLATAVATQLSWLLVERRCLAIKSTARPSAFRHALRQA